jgi:hypothetical protein
MRTRLLGFAACGALTLGIATAASDATVSGFTGVAVDQYGVGNYCVADIYFTFNLNGATLLNIYNSSVSLEGGLGQLYHNDSFGGSWNPQLANASLDTFATIGGGIGFGNTTAADPGWGLAGFNQTGIPGGAGWYNAFPPNGQGLAGSIQTFDLFGNETYNGLGTLVMRLVIHQSLVGPNGLAFAFSGDLTFNTGLGTAPSQPSFDLDTVLWVPAPGAFALLGLAGVVGGRRRRR